MTLNIINTDMGFIPSKSNTMTKLPVYHSHILNIYPIVTNINTYLYNGHTCSNYHFEQSQSSFEVQFKADVDRVKIRLKPRHLSDNDPCYMSKDLKEYLEQGRFSKNRRSK